MPLPQALDAALIEALKPLVDRLSTDLLRPAQLRQVHVGLQRAKDELFSQLTHISLLPRHLPLLSGLLRGPAPEGPKYHLCLGVRPR